MVRSQRELEYLSLPTVAALVHIRTQGFPPDASKPEAMGHALNVVAHAISNVVPIYALNENTGLPLMVTLPELSGGKFLRGAHALVTAGGKEYRGLSVQRKDMDDDAIVVLRSAGFSIKTTPNQG